MKIQLILILFASGILACGCSVSAQAQQSCIAPTDHAWSSLWNGNLFPPVAPAAYGCFSTGPWVAECLNQSYRCTPKADDVCPTCPKAGGPIALSTGNTYINQTDVRVPGLSRGLTLNRSWNSRTAYGIGLFGAGWRSSYEEGVGISSDHYVKYSRGDDSMWSFGFDGFDSAGTGKAVYRTAAPANEAATIMATIQVDPATSYWTLVFKDGETRVFNKLKGYLTSIVDRNGNGTLLAYDSQDRLIAVTDPAGRHLYYNYSGSGRLVQSITTDFGISLTYTYDGQQRLTKVTYPDSSFNTFEYDANSFITAVKDADGKVLESHTYNTCGQGLTSARAGGVESISVAYPLGCGLALP